LVRVPRREHLLRPAKRYRGEFQATGRCGHAPTRPTCRPRRRRIRPDRPRENHSPIRALPLLITPDRSDTRGNHHRGGYLPQGLFRPGAMVTPRIGAGEPRGVTVGGPPSRGRMARSIMPRGNRRRRHLSRLKSLSSVGFQSQPLRAEPSSPTEPVALRQPTPQPFRAGPLDLTIQEWGPCGSLVGDLQESFPSLAVSFSTDRLVQPPRGFSWLGRLRLREHKCPRPCGTATTGGPLSFAQASSDLQRRRSPRRVVLG
jgi:hypothetical protein